MDIKKDFRVEQVESRIRNATDNSLNQNNLSTSLYNEFKIELLKLETQNTSAKIDRETIDFNNPPRGIRFTPGNQLNFAIYKVPILGNAVTLSEIVKRELFQGEKYIDMKSLIYKEFSTKNLEVDHTETERIKNNFVTFIFTIQSLINEYNKAVEFFNEQELRPLIVNEIQTEQERRKLKKDAETRLNPFT